MKEKHKLFVGAVNYLISIVLIILVASVLIVIQGSNPIVAFQEMILGAVGSRSAIASSIRWSTPVLISATAAVVAQKSGINNLGIEGQIYFGAFTAAVVGAYVPGPGWIVIPLAIIAGAIAGLLYAVLPAFLKLRYHIDEMITTLMLNYAAIQFTEYLTMMLMGMGSDTNPDLIATPEIPASAQLTRIMPPYQASTGFFIGLGLVILVFLLYRYTIVGY